MSRVGATLGKLIRLPLLDDTGLADHLLAKARTDAATVGIVFDRVIKIRGGDGKVVALCSHPSWGPCVFKWVSPDYALGAALTHVATMRIARDPRSDLFPEVYHLGTHFSVERRIVGKSLDGMAGSEWNDVDLIDFCNRVRHFNENVPSAPPLAPIELRIALRHEIAKLNSRRRYLGRGGRLMLRLRTVRHGRELQRLMDAASRAIMELPLPRGMSIGDLGSHNVIRDDATGGVHVIDAEHIRAGHFIFGCLWFLTSLARRNCPAPAVVQMYHHICSDEFLRVPGAEHAARMVLSVFVEASLLVLSAYNPGLETLRHLLAADLLAPRHVHAPILVASGQDAPSTPPLIAAGD